MSDILSDADAYTEPCFSLRNRILRTVWGVVYVLLFRYSPKTFHLWRIFLLRCFGASIGRHCHIYPKAVIWAPWNLEMGDYSCFADDVICYSMAKIKVGDRCVISQGARLIAATHDYNDPRFPLVARRIDIMDHVWVASEAFISYGVRINEGAVIGARSVVTKDIPEWTVCAGNPCSVVKERKRPGA